MLHEVGDAALVLELDLLAGAALVDQLDLQAAGQEGGLAQALGEGLEVELDLVAEDLHVRLEGDRRAGGLDGAALLELGGRLAALVGLGPDVAVAPDLEVELLGERVDDRDADAVQPARDLVAAAVAELAAGVEGGEHDLGRGLAQLRVLLDGDAAAVVDDGAAVVGVKGDDDLLGVAGDRLVDGVVHDLVDEVMEAAGAGRADVHARALADGLEALEDGDVLGPIAVLLALGLRLRGGLGLVSVRVRTAAIGGGSAGGALLAGASAVSGLRHSASFRLGPVGSWVHVRGPHAGSHKDTNRRQRKLRQGATKSLQITYEMGLLQVVVRAKSQPLDGNAFGECLERPFRASGRRADRAPGPTSRTGRRP